MGGDFYQIMGFSSQIQFDGMGRWDSCVLSWWSVMRRGAACFRRAEFDSVSD